MSLCFNNLEVIKRSLENYYNNNRTLGVLVNQHYPILKEETSKGIEEESLTT